MYQSPKCKEKGKRKMKRVFWAVLITVTAIFIGVNAYKSGEMHQLEVVEHSVDTMTTMQGIYEGNGIIVTDDGNIWEVTDEALNDGVSVTVIFQTYGKPVEQWEIVSVNGEI